MCDSVVAGTFFVDLSSPAKLLEMSPGEWWGGRRATRPAPPSRPANIIMGISSGNTKIFSRRDRILLAILIVMGMQWYKAGRIA